jgi:predicted transposase/invertase (TIGR01784 family)
VEAVNEPNHPHDALFKMTFGNVTRAAAELRAILPPVLARAIDLQTLERVDSSFVDRRFRKRHSDLLFRAMIGGKPGYLYLLFEHRSDPDGLMPFRTLRYVVLNLERYIDEVGAANALPLPIVIPIVLHHGDSGWRGATCTAELFDQELVRRLGLGALIPQLSFILDDLARLSNEELAARNLDDFTALVLWSLRDARTARRLLASLTFWGPRLERLARADTEAVEQILRYLWLVVSDAELETFLTALHAAAPATEPLTMTLAEQLEARGIAKGRAEGEARGKAEGLRRVLTHQLTLKFGTVTASASERIQRASEEQLLFWSERVLSAASLSDVIEAER